MMTTKKYGYVRELSTGPIRVANNFGRDKKAT